MVAPSMDNSAQRASSSKIRNAEASILVSAYRRAVPIGARRVIASRFTPQLRSAVKQKLAASQAVSDRIASQRVVRTERRFSATFSQKGRRTVLVNRHPRVALVRQFPSPLQAYMDTLISVCGALDEAGIYYVCIRGVRQSSSTLAVSEDDRQKVLDALRRLCSDSPAYVSLGSASPSRRRSRRSVVLGQSSAVWRRIAKESIVCLFWYYTDSRGVYAIDDKFGCEIEFWQSKEDGALLAPRRNPITNEIAGYAKRIEAPLSSITKWAPTDSPKLRTVRTLPEFSRRHTEDISFPIDAVYTWVDGADPEWLKRRAAAEGDVYHEEAANAARYISRDELRYSLRSLHQYAPWIRRVYLVTDDQVPEWLRADHPRIHVVSHRQIFSDSSLLPTFNSHAIESQLHHIEGLSEHFVYLNDDVFFGRLVSPQSFFLSNGLTRFFLSKAHIPQGLPTPEDVPVSVAGKNNRIVLADKFGAVITQKMKHVPHALRRSVLYEIEEEFSERHRETAANKFRSLNDLSVTSSLHHYYAYLTGKAIPSGIRYDYFDLSHTNTAARLGRLLNSRNRDTFCVNDTVSDDVDLESQFAVMKSFLEDYFPYVSPFERDR
jgi:hypothetical protein